MKSMHNVLTDPGERHNLAVQQPARVAELTKVLEQQAARDGDPTLSN